EYQNRPVEPWEFRAKPAWQRFLVMIAGVVMNVVLAIAIYCGISYTWGESYFSNDDARWGYNFNEAGERLGFRDGDRLVTVDGEKVDDPLALLNALLITEKGRTVVVERAGEAVSLDLPLEALIALRQEKGYENLFTLRQPFVIDSVVAPTAALLQRGDEIVGMEAADGEKYRGLEFFDYKALLQLHAGQEVRVTVLRDGEELEFALPVSAEGTLGVIRANPYTPRTRHYTLGQSIPAGFRKAGRTIASYWQQLKLIVRPKTELYKEVGGFLSIGSIFPGSWNWEDFWLKTAFLSIILAVMNILPIPGLDGGHAIFTFWEMLTGRKVSDKVLEGAQYVGLIVIVALLLYANGNDIYRFFIK
ncbi:MAG: site-2 protease family protein, partial [Alistipes sp.]|nr:site-2 protease family protein [Alistipes sp.]